MGQVEYILIAATAILVLVAAAGLSRRIGVAAPLLLVAIGAGLSYLPDAPVIHLESEWILLIVLPPLLYGAAVAFPVIDFRRNLAPIALLGVALVIISALVVGLVLFALFPELNLASAIALGAVLSPTDAVSATSIAKRLGLPARVTTVLEGESLVNDASALVLLRTAIAAGAAAFDLPTVVGTFIWATVVAVAVGLAVGVLAAWVRGRFNDPVLVTSISFAIPFFSYAPAEALGASGVIAVVTTGLIVGHHTIRAHSEQLRFAEQTNWRTVQFLLENGVFLLMGYQLREYIADDIHDGYQPGYTIALGLLAVLVLVAVRLAFTLPMFAGLGKLSGDPLGMRRASLVGWSGMRGVVTVAAVQSLPPETPYRSALILIAFTAAAATLLLGGLTLPPLARRLGLQDIPPPATSLPE